MSTFTWSPAPGATVTIKPRVRTAQFGDGYSQRIGDGINTNVREWSLAFNRKTAPIDAISAFLEARAGVESFVWQPPVGSSGKWICSSFSRAVTSKNFNSLTATFMEVFGD